MACEHPLDAAYLYPVDTEVLDLRNEDGDLLIDVAVPCPECDQALKLTTRVESKEPVDLELPLDDPEDPYD